MVAFLKKFQSVSLSSKQESPFTSNNVCIFIASEEIIPDRKGLKKGNENAMEGADGIV